MARHTDIVVLQKKQSILDIFFLGKFDELTDQGRRDPPALQSLLWDDNTGKCTSCAECAQVFGISLAAVAESEIVTADKACCALFQQLLQLLVL